MCESQLNAQSLEWMKPPDNVPVPDSFERLKVQSELGFKMEPEWITQESRWNQDSPMRPN